MVGVRNRAGGVDDSVPPESLEEFVRPTPKQDRVEAAALACSSSGTTQSKLPSGAAKYPSAVAQLNITIRRACPIFSRMSDLMHSGRFYESERSGDSNG